MTKSETHVPIDLDGPIQYGNKEWASAYLEAALTEPVATGSPDDETGPVDGADADALQLARKYIWNVSEDLFYQEASPGVWGTSPIKGIINVTKSYDIKWAAFTKAIRALNNYYHETDHIYDAPNQWRIRRGNVAIRNCFSGWLVEPEEGDWSEIDRVIRNLVEQDERHYNWLLDWIAKPLQSLRIDGVHKKNGTCVLIHGVEGAGKGLLAMVLRLLYNDLEYFAELDQDALDGKFQSLLKDKLFVVGNEVQSTGRNADRTMNMLKTWITEQTYKSNEKHVKEKPAENRFNMMLFSNFDDPLKISKTDRRFVVFHNKTSLARDKQAKALGRRLERALKEKEPTAEVCAFLNHLLSRDLSAFDSTTPLKTEALEALKIESISSAAQFVKDIQELGWPSVYANYVKAMDGRSPLPTQVHASKPSIVPFNTIYAAYCVEAGRGAESKKALGRALNDMGLISIQCRDGSGINQRCRDLPIEGTAQSDLVFVKDAKGGSFRRDHLKSVPKPSE